MKKEIADKWIAALESGKYKQGRSSLRFNNEFCCLGVLCELAVEAGVITEAKRILNGQSLLYYYDDCNASYLPSAVRDWAGMYHIAGIFNNEVNDDDRYLPSLTRLNDDGVSFVEIADVIRKNVENL